MNIPFHFVGRLMQHHCQKDGWCLQKGIFLQNEGYGKSISAHYQLFLSLQGYTLSLVKLVQWWKFGFYKMVFLFGALRFRLCPTILYPSKFLVPIHFVGFLQCPPFCVYKRGGSDPMGLISTGIYRCFSLFFEYFSLVVIQPYSTIIIQSYSSVDVHCACDACATGPMILWRLWAYLTDHVRVWVW